MERKGPLLAAAVLALARAASAHPMPFSTLDVRVDGALIEVTLTAHAFDLGHDLGTAAEALLDPRLAARHAEAIAALVSARLAVAADGRPLPDRWSAPVVVPERQSLRVRLESRLPGPPGVLTVRGRLFPYDPEHQTFVNVYQGGPLVSQAILDGQLEHFLGGAAGRLAIGRKFLVAGVRHIASGPDHLLFLLGLLLLGGTVRRLALVVSAFTVGHSITLSLAALAAVSPPARIIEPAIALSIVCVGADNLLTRGGRDIRDIRHWFALGFGLVHGFGFASVLRAMGLPTGALVWSLFSFNLGVEVGQLAVVALVAAGLGALRARSEQAGRRLAFAGSVGVMAAGTFWFIQRLFFLGGIS